MKKKQIFWVGVLSVLIVTAAVRAGAQAKQALNLTLLKTFIRTQTNTLDLTQNEMQAFSPTVVDCPTIAKSGCTLEIEVAGQFRGNNIQITVAVSDGSGLPGIDPAASIVVCGAGCNPDTEPFRWMQRGVPAGTKATVTVAFFDNYNGTSQAYDRIETIQLFKN